MRAAVAIPFLLVVIVVVGLSNIAEAFFRASGKIGEEVWLALTNWAEGPDR